MMSTTRPVLLLVALSERKTCGALAHSAQSAIYQHRALSTRSEEDSYILACSHGTYYHKTLRAKGTKCYTRELSEPLCPRA